MEFRWFCRQTTENYPMDPNAPTQLLYENGDVVPETRRTQEEINQIKNETGIDFQSGGCFGRGPGRTTKDETNLI